jgi:hypothetical protein
MTLLSIEIENTGERQICKEKLHPTHAHLSLRLRDSAARSTAAQDCQLLSLHLLGDHTPPGVAYQNQHTYRTPLYWTACAQGLPISLPKICLDLFCSERLFPASLSISLLSHLQRTYIVIWKLSLFTSVSSFFIPSPQTFSQINPFMFDTILAFFLEGPQLTQGSV